MLKRHHFLNLAVMRENSSQVSKTIGDSRDIIYDLGNDKINSDIECQQKVDDLVKEHTSN